MATAITYDWIRREIGRFLAFNDDHNQWSPEDAQRVADIIARGSRRFYYPETMVIGDQALPHHDWSFLQKLATLALTANLRQPLPADFVRITERPTIDTQSTPLEEVSDSDIRTLDNAGSTGTTVYYAVKRSTVDPLSYEMMFHPVPAGGEALQFWYLFQPAEIGPTQDPIVPVNHTETYIAVVLATADEMMNYETASEGRHLERAKTLMLASMRMDRTIGDEHSDDGTNETLFASAT